MIHGLKDWQSSGWRRVGMTRPTPSGFSGSSAIPRTRFCFQTYYSDNFSYKINLIQKFYIIRIFKNLFRDSDFRVMWMAKFSNLIWKIERQPELVKCRSNLKIKTTKLRNQSNIWSNLIHFFPLPKMITLTKW